MLLQFTPQADSYSVTVHKATSFVLQAFKMVYRNQLISLEMWNEIKTTIQERKPQSFMFNASKDSRFTEK